MAQQYVQVTKKDLGKGIDAFSAKGAIPDGYVERLENADTNANGKLSTRTGYEGYYGWLPFRVTEVTHTGTKIRFKLDGANTVDFSTAKRGPLVAYGKLSYAQSGDLSTTDASVYYPSYEVTSTDILTAGSGTLTKTASETGVTSANVWSGIAESTTTGPQDN